MTVIALIIFGLNPVTHQVITRPAGQFTDPDACKSAYVEFMKSVEANKLPTSLFTGICIDTTLKAATALDSD